MSKYNLTIATDDANELLKILNVLSGSTSLTVATLPAAAPVVQPAFTAPVMQPDTNISNGQLDSKGMPWDGRIHAETKATNKDGTWRGRRGVDNATIAAVETELRARAPITMEQPESLFGAPAPQFAAPAFNAPVMEGTTEIPAFLQPQPVAAPPQPVAAPPQPVAAPPQPVAAPPQPVAPGTVTFQQIMAAISQGLRDKKIDNAWLQSLVTHFQIPSFPTLANSHASLIPNVVTELKKVGVM